MGGHVELLPGARPLRRALAPACRALRRARADPPGVQGVSDDALDGRVTGDAERDRRSNPITYPGEIDNFFQPHYQLLHDVDLSKATHFSQTAYLFQGDGYYDQFRANRSLVEYNLANVVLPGGTVIKKTDLMRRRNVDEWDAGWVPSLTRTSGRWTLGLQGEVRVHRAHHEGTVTWAQYYPLGVAPNQPYYDYRAGKATATVAGNVRFAASPRLSLSGGLQVAHHGYTLSDDHVKGVTMSPTYNFLLPRAGAVYTLGSSSNAYVNVARGMRGRPSAASMTRRTTTPPRYRSTPRTCGTSKAACPCSGPAGMCAATCSG